MSITTTAHLNFRGQAREALTFYASVFGGEVTAFTHEQAGRPHGPDEADQLAWGQVRTGDGFRVMAFDVPKARPFDRGQESFFVSVRGTDEDELRAFWAGLAEGAEVRDDLGPATWSPLYGMLTDRFGVTWVLDLEVQWS
jgi:PhnB protein